MVVAKRDTSRNLCVNVVLIQSAMSPPAGLTLPGGFVLDSASVGPASACPTIERAVDGGWPRDRNGGGGIHFVESPPSVVDVDIRVTLPGYDEAIIARNVNTAVGCL